MSDVTDRGGFVFFWNEWPSQWHPAPFTIDGVAYVCAEQFMMAEKARLFGDDETRGLILGTESPREHKALGRVVEGFDEARWTAACREIVYRGNVAKFGEHAELVERKQAWEEAYRHTPHGLPVALAGELLP